MEVLWINKFDFSGNTEAVINWAKGVRQKGLQLHLVLTEVPAPLLHRYDNHLNQAGLKSSVNINRQQIQNLLYYRSFDLLHIFHHDLYPMAKELSNFFCLPWVASVFDGEERENFPFLSTACCITCSNSKSFLEVKKFFYPHTLQNIILLPQGVAIKKESFFPVEKMSILSLGALKPDHLPAFQALNRVLQDLKLPFSLGVVSDLRYTSLSTAAYYPWSPDLCDILPFYNIMAGFGYYMLQGIAAGKIALILEEKYGGLFLPSQREQLPDLRAKGQREDPHLDYKLLKRDLKALYERLQEVEKLREETWHYARENHNLEIIAGKILRLYGLYAPHK